jgi:hypothetical protein
VTIAVKYLNNRRERKTESKAGVIKNGTLISQTSKVKHLKRSCSSIRKTQ